MHRQHSTHFIGGGACRQAGTGHRTNVLFESQLGAELLVHEPCDHAGFGRYSEGSSKTSTSIRWRAPSGVTATIGVSGKVRTTWWSKLAAPQAALSRVAT